MEKPPVPKTRRRLWKILAALSILLVLTTAALPWLASTAPARKSLLAAINRGIAPARFEIGSLRLAWFGPVRASGLALIDAHDKRLFSAPTATLDRGLFSLLLDHSHLGTLTLEAAAIEIERRADGSIDLVEVFQPKPRPAPSAPQPGVAAPAATVPVVTLKIKQGSLLVRSPDLIEPLRADRMDLTVEIPEAPYPLSLSIELANGTGDTTESLALQGEFDHRAKPPTVPDLGLRVKGHRWPLSAQVSELSARGRLDGTIDARRRSGLWTLKGDAGLLEIAATGEALAGDRLRFDRVSGSWELTQTATAWTVARLDLASPVGSLSAKGVLTEQPGSVTRLEGRIDLASLARQLPHALRLREGLTLERGEALLQVDVKSEEPGQTLTVEAHLSDLIARDEARTIAVRDPAHLSARVTRRARAIRVERLTAKTGFLDLSGAGDLDQGVILSGMVDLGKLDAQLRDLLDFGGVSLSGRAGLAADYRQTGTQSLARFAAEFRKPRIVGLTTDPIERDEIHIDASATGTVAESGMPGPWKSAKLNLKSGDVRSDVAVSLGQGSTAITAGASASVTLAEYPARAETRFTGRWHDKVLEIDDATIALHSAAARNPAPSIQLAARGWFDPSAGELHLEPVAGASPEPIGLGATGLRITGLNQSGAILKIDAGLGGDLAALDRIYAAWTGTPPEGLAGQWQSGFNVSQGSDGRVAFELGLAAPNLTLPGSNGKERTDAEPLGVAIKATYQAQGAMSWVEFEAINLASQYVGITAKGQLDDLAGRRLADFQGTVSPNWAGINQLAATMIEPGARLSGLDSRVFSIKGPLAGASAAEILKGLEGEFGLELTEIDAFGMNLGPAPLVIRCQGGKAFFLPIKTTLNNGEVALRPDLRLDDPKGIWLRLAPGSSIRGAEINDAVSKQVLSFVAPVLNGATRVKGRVSANLDRAEFPIGGDETRTMTMTGKVVFDDVIFSAGPLAKELLSVTGRKGTPTLKMQDPIQLSVANGRVNQKGLAIPVGRDAKMEIDGSVGFDRTLALRAVVPITAEMLGQKASIDEKPGATKVTIPIGGTLSQPRIDVRALQVALGEAGKTLLKNGAASFLDRLVSPPRPTAGAAPRRTPNDPALGKKIEDEIFRQLMPQRRATPMPD